MMFCSCLFLIRYVWFLIFSIIPSFSTRCLVSWCSPGFSTLIIFPPPRLLSSSPPPLSSFFLSLSAVDRSGSVGSGQPLVNAIRTDSALIGGTEPFHPVALYWNRNVSSCSTRIFLFGTPLWQIISQASPPDIHLSNTNIKNTSVWLFWTDRRSGPKKVPHHLLLKLRTDVELQRKSKVMCQTRVHLKLI